MIDRGEALALPGAVAVFAVIESADVEAGFKAERLAQFDRDNRPGGRGNFKRDFVAFELQLCDLGAPCRRVIRLSSRLAMRVPQVRESMRPGTPLRAIVLVRLILFWSWMKP